MTLRYGHSASGYPLSVHRRTKENAGEYADKLTGKCVAGLGPQPFEGTVPGISRLDRVHESFPKPADGLGEPRKSQTYIPDTVGMPSRSKSQTHHPCAGAGIQRRYKSENHLPGAGAGRLRRRKSQNHHPGIGTDMERRHKSEIFLHCIGVGMQKAVQGANPFFGTQTSINALHAVSRRRCALTASVLISTN